MDKICIRFPSLIQRILSNLDNQSLIRFKEASRKMDHFLNNERSYLIRIIKMYYENFEGHEESWKEAIKKTPFDIVKQLVDAVQQFFKTYPYKDIRLAPLHVVAEKGSLKLFDYIIKRAKNKNPYGKIETLASQKRPGILGELVVDKFGKEYFKSEWRFEIQGMHKAIIGRGSFF